MPRLSERARVFGIIALVSLPLLLLATACMVAMVAFWAYTRTLLPGVDLGDTGGFQAAVLWPEQSARRAYPLYYTLATPFITLVSAENPARGLNLFSAIWAAIAVGLLAAATARLTKSPLAGAASGLLLAFSFTFWTQAIIAEVYSLHLALVAGLCVLGWWLAFEGVPGGLVGRSQSLLLYPFNPYVFSLPFFLPMLGLPIAVSVSAVFGFVHGMFQLGRFGGLPVSLLMLMGLYFAGVTEYYGAARFLSYVVLPATFFLGLFGKATLEDLDLSDDRGRNLGRSNRLATLDDLGMIRVYQGQRVRVE